MKNTVVFVLALGLAVSTVDINAGPIRDYCAKALSKYKDKDAEKRIDACVDYVLYGYKHDWVLPKDATIDPADDFAQDERPARSTRRDGTDGASHAGGVGGRGGRAGGGAGGGAGGDGGGGAYGGRGGKGGAGGTAFD